MLQSIRDRTQGWLTSTIIGLLVIVFACWGIHGFLELNNESGDKIVAKVAGKTLSQRDFDTFYQQRYRLTKLQLGTNSPLNEELISHLKKQTLDQWTLAQVLIHSASQEHYRVSQSAVDSALLHMPIFQSSGRFSSRRFYSVLHVMGYTESQFLTNLKQTLLINQVQRAIPQTAFFLPGELNNTIALLHQKRDFAYAILTGGQFVEKQSIFETQALSYYQNHKDRFIQPEQVSIEYIKLSQAAANNKTFLKRRDILANISYMHPDSLESAAKALGLPIQSTALFDRMGGHNVLTKNAKVIAATFKPDILQGNNSPVIDLDANTAIVLRIKQHKISTLQPFSAVKAQIMEDLKKQMAGEEMHLMGERLLKELRGKKEGVEISKLNLNWHKMLQADRSDDKPSPAIIKAVFNLPYPGKTEKIPLVTGFLLPNGDYALIKLIAVHDGDSKNLSTSEREVYGKALEKNFGELDYDLYVHSLIKTK